MKAFSLMYHDVILPGGFKDSGIQGADADLYKLDRDEFCRHLDAIAKLGAVRTCTDGSNSDSPVFLTFDDGGASSRWIGEGDSQRRSGGPADRTPERRALRLRAFWKWKRADT